MCGLFGKYSPNLIRHYSTDLSQGRRLTHRGPDGEGEFLDKNKKIYFYHCRLSIVDLSHTGNQPMDNDEVIIVFNGMIYNYKDLKVNYLTDYHFKSSSDTEVILALYLRFGISMLSKLDGMFSLAIYDSRIDELFLARDELGIKPLYFTERAGTYYFASEAKSLITDSSQLEIDIDGLSDYLVYQCFLGRETLLRGIYSVEPGKVITISDKGTISSDFSFTPSFDLANLSDRDWINLTREEVTKSVEKHLLSDREIAVFLSGGLDSSLVYALASNLLKSPIEGFSGFYPEFPNLSEIPYSELVARQHGGIHRLVPIQAHDYYQAYLRMIYANDFPASGPPGPSLAHVSRVMSSSFKVALGGLGGDELFLGYFRHFNLAQMFVDNPPISLGVSPQILQHNLKYFSNYKGASRNIPVPKDIVIAYSNSLDRLGRGPHNSTLIEFRDLALQRFRSLFEKTMHSSSDLFDLLKKFDRKTVLLGLLQTDDRASMLSGIELRVPLLTPSLVNLTDNMPKNLLLQHGPKGMLRECFKDLLPHEIIARRDKQGFPTPFSSFYTKWPGLNPINPKSWEYEHIDLSFLQIAAVNSMNSGSYLPEDRFMWGIINIMDSFRHLESLVMVDD